MLDPRSFDRRLRATGAASLAVVFLFFGALAYWQVFRTDLAGRADNPRTLEAFHDPSRGRILDRDGNVLAATDPSGARTYTDVSLAHVVGYLDARYGSAGAELAFNEWLAGDAGTSWDAAFDAEFKRHANKGLDVRLTIESSVQAAAVDALAGRPGAVVALDPRTGEVLAMLSLPAFDPAGLAASGEELSADPAAPLLNRATQGLYPPGSTFKTVTALAALDHDVIEPGTTVECPGEVVIDGFPISCSNVPQGIGTYPFSDAFAYSVNAVFAQVGVALGWGRLLDTASALGFGAPLDFALETATTRVLPPGADASEVLLATTAFGQGGLQASPLQMALVAATVANDGVLHSPRIGLAVYDGDRTVAEIDSTGERRVVPEAVARQVREMMVAVVEKGQAAGVAIPGVRVAGKTGTAESGTGTSHAWFIGFAPADEPRVAVAVVVEDGGQGGSVASPVAGAVIRAALGS